MKRKSWVGTWNSQKNDHYGNYTKHRNIRQHSFWAAVYCLLHIKSRGICSYFFYNSLTSIRNTELDFFRCIITNFHYNNKINILSRSVLFVFFQLLINMTIIEKWKRNPYKNHYSLVSIQSDLMRMLVPYLKFSQHTPNCFPYRSLFPCVQRIVLYLVPLTLIDRVLIITEDYTLNWRFDSAFLRNYQNLSRVLWKNFYSFPDCLFLLLIYACFTANPTQRVD